MINILLKISLFSPRFCESVPGSDLCEELEQDSKDVR